MSNTDIYDALSRPPADALKTIGGGRLRGMTDIKPQWRYKAMTEQFGPCGIGWRFSVDRLWIEETGGQTLIACAHVNLQIKVDGEWSNAIPGIGGSQLVAIEKDAPYANDEAYKMAVTDGLSTAMKMLGVAADVYMGQWDGSKYKDTPVPTTPQREVPQQPKKSGGMTPRQVAFQGIQMWTGVQPDHDNFGEVVRNVIASTPTVSVPVAGGKLTDNEWERVSLYVEAKIKADQAYQPQADEETPSQNNGAEGELDYEPALSGVSSDSKRSSTRKKSGSRRAKRPASAAV